MEFVALPKQGNPTHTLTVTIDDQAHAWPLAENLELVFDQSLAPNATIRISTSKPPSFGHAIDICLTVTQL